MRLYPGSMQSFSMLLSGHTQSKPTELPAVCLKNFQEINPPKTMVTREPPKKHQIWWFGFATFHWPCTKVASQWMPKITFDRCVYWEFKTPHRVEIRRMLGNNFFFFEGKLMCLMWGHITWSFEKANLTCLWQYRSILHQFLKQGQILVWLFQHWLQQTIPALVLLIGKFQPIS